MRNLLTETELETLATFIRNAGRHMSTARDSHGNHVWPSVSTDPGSMITAYEEMLAGFYALQPDHWATLVHVNA